jgi:methylmalonyl-CoA/ethylmalonyl-CoA epimerase
MSLTRIHHIAAIVHDADEALGLWRDTLGLRVAKDEVVEDQGVRGVMLPMANCEIELLQPVRDDTGVARFLEARGEGLHHICFESTDVTADLRAAKARGLEMIDEAPRPGLAGQIGFIHPRSNHGVLIEYAQPPTGEQRPAASEGEAWVPRQLGHIVCAVHDRAKVGERLIENFGFADGGQNRFEAFGIESWFLDMGDTQLELVSPLSEDVSDPLVRRLRKGEGMFRLVLEVDDVGATVARLRDGGVECTDPMGEAAITFVRPSTAHGVPLVFA